jgi:DNA repair protein RadA/Sms
MKPEDIARYLRRIINNGEGSHFFLASKDMKGKFRNHPFKRRDIKGAVSFITKHANRDLYMSAHNFSEPLRQKEVSIDPFHFYADLDECNPRTLDIKPTLAFESSPGRYVGYWFCDKPVPEELNRRLAYHIGADTSGWDRTQVLRIPGTKNHKYDEKPEVKVLWTDGPRYEVDRLDKMIPELTTEDDRPEGGDATDIYREYEKAIPRGLRREFTNPKVVNGKRSEVLWKMINACIEAGMTSDETFTVMWHNAWNKFQDRRGGERMMERQIDKALGRHVGGSAKKPKKQEPNRKERRKQESINRKDPEHKPKDEESKGRFQLITMDQVTEENIDWYVEQMVAPGQTTMIEGDPGVGKSYFLQYMCIHFCDGLPLPWEDDQSKREPMRVAYLDTENAMGAVTKVRLVDNGLKNQHNFLQVTDGFSFDDDDSIDAFEREIIQGWRPHVVVVDPVTLYLGGADSHKASDVQQALQDMKEMAEEYGFALILVRHLNKSNSGKALYAGNGSIGFAGLARVIATVGWHPETPNVRVVACTKNNLAPPFGSLGYEIVGLPATMKHKYRSQLEYIGREDFTADDIVSTTNKKEDNSKDIAADLIREEMAKEGDINYHSLLASADKRSISESSIKKAAGELGLKRITRGRGRTRKTYLVDQSAEE